LCRWPERQIIHHPNYDTSVFMPFVPGIKIKSGKILWLAGTTALPVYHDNPHKRISRKDAFDLRRRHTPGQEDDPLS
jgi:hypothetical protein